MTTLSTSQQNSDEPTATAFSAAALQSSDDGIIGLSLDMTVITWNIGAERLYGYRAEDMIGQPFAILVPDDKAEEHAHSRG